jgi:hypothetical protein
MHLITHFVELRVVAGRSRTRAGRPHAVYGRPMLNHTCHAHAALCRDLEKSLSERHGSGMARARRGRCMDAAWTQHGRGMTCVNQTRLHCAYSYTIRNSCTILMKLDFTGQFLEKNTQIQ